MDKKKPMLARPAMSTRGLRQEKETSQAIFIAMRNGLQRANEIATMVVFGSKALRLPQPAAIMADAGETCVERDSNNSSAYRAFSNVQQHQSFTNRLRDVERSMGNSLSCHDILMKMIPHRIHEMRNPFASAHP
jgi:hypothetical protein